MLSGNIRSEESKCIIKCACNTKIYIHFWLLKPKWTKRDEYNKKEVLNAVLDLILLDTSW